MSHSHRHNKTLRNRVPRRTQEFSEHSLPRRGSFRLAGLEQHLLSSCPARDCVCSAPQRSPHHFQFTSERPGAGAYNDERERFYTVSRCGSQISVQSSQISRAPSYENTPATQYQTHVEYRAPPEPEQCQMHGTPFLERRKRHRDCDHAYGQEYDVSSMMSEIEHLSLYSSNSRKQSIASSVESHSKVKSVAKKTRQEPNYTKSEPSSPGHSCYSQNASPGHSFSSETRGTWRDEPTPGCCSIQSQETDYDSLISGQNCPAKEPVVSNCVKNFMSWMAEKAEKGTSAFLDSLPSISKEDFHVVMIGLDGAGKTTALYRLKFDQYMNTVPTVGFNCERVKGTVGKSKGLTFLIWDVGGQEKIRPLWRSYTRCTDGIIFVLDSSEEEKFEEAKVELFRTMKYQDNSSIPLLVLANKQDLQNAWSPEAVEEALGLKDLTSSLWHIEPSCSVTGEGLDTGLNHLQMLINKRKKIAKRNRNKTK